MKAFSPDGVPIVGTSETIPGTAIIRYDSFRRTEEGKIDFDYAGDTDVCWDAQETITKDGKAVYVDEDGNEWDEDEIVLKDDDDEEGEDE